MSTVRALVRSADPFARSSLRQALRQAGVHVDAEHADTLVWDMGMAGQTDWPDLGLPVLALASDAEQARAALVHGADAVLLRALDGARILAALQALQGGLRVVDAAFGSVLGAGLEPVPEHIGRLTPRETQVLAAMADGLSNRGIGKRLGCSEHTAKFHVNAVLDKLAARNRTDAVVRALRWGILGL